MEKVMNEIRVDRSLLPRVKRTPEGYLRGEAVVTRVGVFKYVNADGSERLELRHPDDVLQADSLESLKMIPITVDHPGQLVTVDNAAELSVGHTGENIQVDDGNVHTRLTITAARGIEAIGKGKQELSLGYRLDLTEEKGEYLGQPYTHRQRNIVYNHLAIVDSARAGKAARLNLDGAAVQSECNEQMEVPMLKVNVDGIQYDAAPEVAKALEKADQTVVQLRKDAVALEARLDEAEAARKLAETAATEAKANNDASKVAGLVKQRIALLESARPFLNDDSDLLDLSDRDLQLRVIKSVHKDFDGKDRSDEYVAARFDSVVEGGGGRAARVDQLGTPRSESRGDAEVMAESWKKSISNLNDWRNKA